MRPRRRAAAALALTGLLAACAAPRSPAPPPAPTPAYLTAPTGCAVLAGGSIGSQFSDPQVTATWDRVNAAITTELHDRLVAQRLPVIKYLVPTQRPGPGEGLVDGLVMEQLAMNRCNRLLQVSHQVDEDAGGRYFRFDVTLMRLEPNRGDAVRAGSISVRTVGEFSKAYRYPRTQEALDSFYTGDFADRVLSDLNASGALGVLR